MTMKCLDLTGRRFGTLVAVDVHIDSDGKRKWLCQCDCGNMCHVAGFTLNGGKRNSCGCSKLSEDLTGRRFGKLLVEEFSHRIPSTGRIVYACKCDCGQSIKVPSRYLQRGTAGDCGCGSRTIPSRFKPEMPQLVARILDTYIRNASKRGLPFTLEREIFESMILDKCHYCGNEPSRSSVLRDVTLMWNGIDRKDNLLGYIQTNVVTCCSDCNYMKNKRDYKTFVDKITSIHKNLNLSKQDEGLPFE